LGSYGERATTLFLKYRTNACAIASLSAAAEEKEKKKQDPKTDGGCDTEVGINRSRSLFYIGETEVNLPISWKPKKAALERM